MTKSRTRIEQENKVSQWLCDEFGDKGEKPQDYLVDARDFMKFMKSNGWEFRPAIAIIRERQPF